MSEFLRSVPLDDIHIRSGGTGRTVEAYAAVFDELAEIIDGDGHYLEKNAPTAWNKTIADRGGRFPVVYHHGLTIAGTPSERGSVPIGVSTTVRADARGVLTISEYSKSELADEVLEAIRTGSVTAQSYAGRFIKNDPPVPRGGFRAGRDGALRTVTRLEVAMREFGPTPFPAFATAAITGIRTEQFVRALLETPPDKRLDWLQQSEGLTTPLEPEVLPLGTPSGAAGQVEEPPEHSARPSLRQHIRAARIARWME